jgi:hypothetical protein
LSAILGVCVSKIVTERREEKEERRSGLAGRTGGNGSLAWAKEEGEGGSTSSRRSLVQRREDLAVARAQAKRAPGGPSPP